MVVKPVHAYGMGFTYARKLIRCIDFITGNCRDIMINSPDVILEIRLFDG